MDAKAKLREQIRLKRNQWGPQAMAALGEAMARHLTEWPLYRKARTVFLYCSLPLEIGTHPLIEQALSDAKAAGIEDFIVIISEGYGRPFSHYKPEEHGGKTELEWRVTFIGDMARKVEEETGVETRSTVLGHVVRGGSPTVRDRVLATRFGTEAARLIANRQYGRMVAMQNGEITSVPLEEAASRTKFLPVDHPLIQSARDIGVCFGDRAPK